MYKILEKKSLGKTSFEMKIAQPLIAKNALPGQFAIVIADEFSERIPLTISDSDKDSGTISIAVDIIGYSTSFLNKFQEGDFLFSVSGPFGNPSEFVNLSEDVLKKKRFLFAAGGLGIAPIYPQIKWLKKRNAYVEAILGARSYDLIIMEEKIKKYADELHIATDDGSYGFKGTVADKLINLMENENKKFDECIIIGPIIMMKYTVLAAQKYNLKTTVSMNTLMVDGTGMCGCCRLTVGGETKFSCVDGPEFDGALVDFDEAIDRSRIFLEEEKIANERCICKNLGGRNA